MSDVKDMLLSAAVMQRQGMEQALYAISDYSRANGNCFSYVCMEYEQIVSKLDCIITELKRTD